jgi:ribosomal protein S18 acetylase RimI-like enzyme
VLRRATTDDGAAVSRVFVAARDEMTYLPRISDEHRPLLGGWFIERNEVWVSEEDGRIDGFFALKNQELSHINVSPDAQNRGLGTEMLAEAKRLRPDGLELWVFQKNVGARRFYERHGFELVKLTDGAENMEREPDALYAWRGA